MSEQKTEQQQIKEMAKILDTTKKPCDCLTVSECLKYHPNCKFFNCNEWSCLGNARAEALYAAGYRKKSDVARDIISKAFERIFPTSEYDGIELIGILREVAAEIGAEVKE